MARRSASDFTEHIRSRIKVRDRNRCLWCGTAIGITIQHRKAKGQGGIGDKHEPLTAADGILLCAEHNEAAEANGQEIALKFGWKVRRNCPVPVELIPVYDMAYGNWYVLIGDERVWMPSNWALSMMAYVLEQ